MPLSLQGLWWWKTPEAEIHRREPHALCLFVPRELVPAGYRLPSRWRWPSTRSWLHQSETDATPQRQVESDIVAPIEKLSLRGEGGMICVRSRDERGRALTQRTARRQAFSESRLFAAVNVWPSLRGLVARLW